MLPLFDKGSSFFVMMKDFLITYRYFSLCNILLHVPAFKSDEHISPNKSKRFMYTKDLCGYLRKML